MAWFTTLEPARVGLVEIFVNPVGREWRKLVAWSDPIDGLRGYLVDGDLYCWGSLPLHRDLRADLKAALPPGSGPMVGVQINQATASLQVTEPRLDPPVARNLVMGSEHVVRLLGGNVRVRVLGEAETEAVCDLA